MILQRDGVSRCVSPGLQLFFQIFRGTTLKGETAKEQLLQELQPGSLIIMDNASFHKTQKTREILEESGHELIFLPPYSPDFNPIEKHFANLKKIRTCQPPDTSIDDIIRLYGS